MVITHISRRPSRAESTRASRRPSHLDAKGALDSDQPYWSPGRSSLNHLSQSPNPYLELRLATAHAAGRRVIGLTERDIAILQALDSYRYLNRHQIQTLFFQGPRSCQYRLKWLVEHSLVNAWHAVIRPGHVRSASIFLLSSRGASALADLAGDDPRPYVLRAEHALSRHHYLVHDLEANQLFVDLARTTSTMPTFGLYHWVGEHGIRRAYAEERGPVPDGWGRVLVGDRELFLHLELDRGSEQTRRLHGKLAAYVSYFRGRPQASCNHVLFVVPTEQRELQVRAIGRRLMEATGECCHVWTAPRSELASNGPLGRVWADVGGPERRVGILEMPSRQGGSRPLADCIGKHYWWERRPGGGEGV
jgi:Replication-relaxation